LILYFQARNVPVISGWDEQFVLVPDVQLMKRAKIEVPSIVRLYLAEDKSGESRAGSANPAKSRYKLVNGRVYGKFEAHVSTGHERANRLEPCIIESGLKVVNGITHDQRKLRQIAKPLQVIVDALNLGLSVNFNSTGLTVWGSDELNSLLNLSDVLIGPLNFKAGISEGHAI
jgi:hypothetical protein